MEDTRRNPRTTLRSWNSNLGLRLPSYPAARPVHVRIGTPGRRQQFADPVLAALTFGAVAVHPETLAACLMPDHLHWLLASAANLSGKVAACKAMTTRLARPLGVRESLWQRSFFDRVVRSREGLAAVARYILDNPRRSGMVAADERYPFAIAWWSRFSAADGTAG
jgi:REP element-mobilizing transposase RayT